MEKNHLGLLCDIGELNALFAGSDNIEAFLDQIVSMVTEHIQADVCSIYLYDREYEELVLKATLGLHKRSVNNTRLKLGEGLVGLAVKEMKPICEEKASSNPNFKPIPDINEEGFESFLVVPIVRGIERIGALVVQRKADDPFQYNDLLALKAITAQLAGAIENTRILMAIHAKHKETIPESRFKLSRELDVMVASEGVVFADAFVVDDGNPSRFLKRPPSQEPYTIADFERAVATTEAQLESFQAQMEKKLAGIASLIFEAHILILKDKEFTGAMIRRIRRGTNPPEAIISVANRYIDKFSASSQAYAREKVKDVEDLARRLYGNLLAEEKSKSRSGNRHIIVAQDVYPSDILKLSTENVAGIILVSGGVTSHVSILARSLQIPLVIAEDVSLLEVPDNTPIILDGESGKVHINPDKTQISRVRQRIRARKQIVSRRELIQPETYTGDGVRIRILANINLLTDLKLAVDLKSEGVGLYRSEFPFMVRTSFPSEEEQVLVYSSLMDDMRNHEINIRTLDIGGEKVLAYYGNANESNPTLGMRSIRFSLNQEDLFRQQLRAILQAGANIRQLRITFPMISSIDEFIEAKEQVLRSLENLELRKIPHCTNPKIGIMVETPSTVEIIDALAMSADFFCIGTNDFVQYMLAVDRANALVASYYNPHHPSIIRSLKKIIDAGTRRGIDVSICGELAHVDSYIPLLLGLGIRILSIDPRYNFRVQQVVGNTSIHEAEQLAAAALQETTVKGVAKLLRL